MSNINFRNPLEQEDYTERLELRKEDVRGPYFRDQTAIIHSMPFRRLKNKAQVFFDPNNDHVCTRIEHSLHVATISATIARGLDLNEELAYAIGLAHDLGHAPFGHAGEDALNRKCECIGGFVHEVHGLRVVDKLGNRGRSLNLTYGVRDGIICHCGEEPDRELEPRDEKLDLSKITAKGTIPSSYEGCIARMSDRIAYLGRDLEDAIIYGYIKKRDVPNRVARLLGTKNGKIIDNLVISIIKSSKNTGVISLPEKKFEVLMELYDFSVERLYNHDIIKNYKRYTTRIIKTVFDYLEDLYLKFDRDYEQYEKSIVPLDRRFGRYLKNMGDLYEKEKASPKAIVRDYVAGMTDSYALRCIKEISLPEELSFDIK